MNADSFNISKNIYILIYITYKYLNSYQECSSPSWPMKNVPDSKDIINKWFWMYHWICLTKYIKFNVLHSSVAIKLKKRCGLPYGSIWRLLWLKISIFYFWIFISSLALFQIGIELVSSLLLGWAKECDGQPDGCTHAMWN